MLAALVLAAVIDCDAYASYEITQPYDENADAVELAEQFANGRGVTRDLGAAISFVCNDAALSDDERAGMLGHLEKMQNGATSEPLDFCDHINGGHGAYVCAERNDKVSVAEMDARLDALQPGAGALRERANAFIEEEALAEAEINRGGTIYPMVLIYARIEAREHFLALLDQLSKERAAATAAAVPPHSKTWLAYREALADWYVARWKGAAPDAALRKEVRALLNAERARSAAARASQDDSDS